MTTVIDTLAIRKETLDRMKMLQLAPIVPAEYRKGNILKSENSRLHYLAGAEQGMIEEVEEECNIFVYHVIKQQGVYNLLFVSCGDWQGEQNDTRFLHPTGCIIAGGRKIFNQIGVRSTYGVLRRIY